MRRQSSSLPRVPAMVERDFVRDLSLADVGLIVGPITITYSDRFLACERSQSVEQTQAALCEEALKAQARAFRDPLQASDRRVERVRRAQPFHDATVARVDPVRHGNKVVGGCV